MDFDEFKTWRDRILETAHIASEDRFDCLNPFKAMDFAKRWSGARTADPKDDVATKSYDAWKSLHFPSGSSSMHFEPTGGVRAALGAMFERMEKDGMELWLPEDVYPFYRQEGYRRAPGLAVRFFRTFPELDLKPLADAADRAAILITDPMTPTGRFLTKQERASIETWTNAGQDRWAIFDSVYLYSNLVPQSFSDDMRAKKFVHLFSMSKSWLLRGVFGFAVGGQDASTWWHGLGVEPTSDACADALDALLTQPGMPIAQSAVFQREWERRGSKLAKYDVVCDGAGGYFRKVNVNHKKALEDDGIMLVPASVFGSDLDDWSIATCLYEAAEQREWLALRTHIRGR